MSKRHGIILGALTLLALALRSLHLLDIMGDPLYRYPLLDEGYYYDQAASLAAGRGIELPFWRPPGLMLVLAAIIKLFGEGMFIPRLVQIILSTTGVLLTYLLARRFFPATVALISGGVVAIHASLIDFSTAIKSTTWVVFLDLGILWILAEASRHRSRWLPLSAGLILGISALFRPVILAFLPAAIIWLHLNREGKRASVHVGLLILGTVLPILPVAYLNSHAAGTPVLISTNGGVNFFIGNNPDYEQTVVARPGREWNVSILDPASDAGFHNPGSDRDRFFYRTAFRYLLDHPGEAATRWVRRLYLVLNGHEIPRDTDIYLSRESSRVLRSLASPAWPRPPGGLLIPMALLGLAVSWPQRRRLALLWSFLLVQALAMALFFVASRYRAPLIPVLSVFSAAGLVWLLGSFRSSPTRGWLALALVLLFMVLFNLPTFETRQSLAAERLYFRGNAMTRESDPAAAIALYRRSIEEDSTDVRPWRTLADRFRELGRPVEEEAALRKAVALAPDNPEDWDRLVDFCRRRGDLEEALRVLEEDRAAHADLPGRDARTSFRIGIVSYEVGRYEEALAAFERGLELDAGAWLRNLPQWARSVPFDEASRDSTGEGEFWVALAFLLEGAGQPEAAVPLFERGVALLGGDPGRRREIEDHLRRAGNSRGAAFSVGEDGQR